MGVQPTMKQKIILAYNLNRNNNFYEAEFDIPLTITTLQESIQKQYECILVECDQNIPSWIAQIINIKPDLIFNVAEGFNGVAREAFYPALYEQLNLNYTGPGPTELLICHNKSLTKTLLQKHDIPMPTGYLISQHNELANLPSNMQFPMIVKLNSEGSSIGMDANCIVNGYQELESQVSHLINQFNKDVLVEEYIEGRDISITFVEGIGILGPVEYVYPDVSIYDFRLKTYENHMIDVLTAITLSQKARNCLFDLSKEIVRVLDMTGYCRIDFRLDSNDKPYLLEVNGQVSFHPIGAFVLAGKEQNLNFDGIVHHIVNYALNHKRRNSKTGIV
jgi:D-alanine-D-alanine ligase